MLERRSIIGGGLAASVAGLLGGAPAEAAQRDRAGDDDVAGAIDRVRALLERQFDSCELGPCVHIAAIRQQQRAFLKAAQKYPDYIEVGLDVWDAVYDWHVKHQQAIQTARTADGRYMMGFMFTNLLLRPEQPGNYVSFGFDNEPPATQAPVR